MLEVLGTSYHIQEIPQESREILTFRHILSRYLRNEFPNFADYTRL
jgi:hypothetical protein